MFSERKVAVIMGWFCSVVGRAFIGFRRHCPRLGMFRTMVTSIMVSQFQLSFVIPDMFCPLSGYGRAG